MIDKVVVVIELKIFFSYGVNVYSYVIVIMEINKVNFYENVVIVVVMFFIKICV